MLSLDKIAYTSKILKNNPNEKIFFSILTMLTTLFLNDIYISIFILCLVYFLIVFVAGIDKKIFFKLMSLPLLFLVISVLTIMITKIDVTKAYIFSFSIFGNDYGFSKEAVKIVIKLVLKSLACISCLYFLVLTTPVIDILYSLEKIKLPKIVTEIVGLVYRYIFILIEASQMIYISQHSRLGYSTMRTSFNSAGKLVSSLFLKALKQADESFIAMEARCYNGEINFITSKYKTSNRNIILTLLLNCLLILLHFFIIKN